MSRLMLALVLALAVVLGGCAGGDGSGSQETAPEAQAETTEIGCERVEAPEPRPAPDLEPPEEPLDADSTYRADVRTTCGDFVITLAPEIAPETTASFVSLAERDFYEGLTFHRVSPGFVIQGGDPAGDGMGGPGYSIEEAPPESVAYERGVVAMAKTEAEPAGTSGSQFFVMLEGADLGPQYAVIGEVTEGMEVVERIGAASTDENERPQEPIVIEGVDIRRG